MTEPTHSGPGGLAGEPPVPTDLWTQAHDKKAPPGWERDLLEKLVLGTLAEQRAARRWRIFWRFAWLAVAALVVWALTLRDMPGATKSGPHTAVVDIKGEIAADAAEIRDWRWVRPIQLARLPTTPGLGEVVEAAFRIFDRS